MSTQASFDRDHVLRKPLFYNAHVTEGNLPDPSTVVWLPMVFAGVTSSGHLLKSLPDLAAELNNMHSALPTSWSKLL